MSLAAGAPVKVAAHLYYSGAWQDISTYVRRSPGASIKRGAANESTTADPSTMTCTLDNNDSRFSWRNPAAALYGLIGRNTPIRIRAGLRLSENLGLATPQEVTTDFASTPDNAALDVVGDIDIAVEFTPFGLSATQCLIAKGTSTGVSGTQLSYQVLLGVSAGVPHVTLRWSTDGSTVKFVDHNMASLTTYAHTAIRVTLDVNNGAGGNTASFYTSSDGTIAGTWTLDGSTTVTAGTTSIFSGTGVVAVAAQSNGGDPFRGIVHAAYIKNGLAGTSVANPNFNAQTAGAASFTDAAGRVWTVQAGAYLDYYLHTRFVGEISGYTPRRDLSGKDRTVDVEAAGVTRRLGQGQNVAALDAMTDYLTHTSTPVVAFVGDSPNDLTFTRTLDAVGAFNPGYALGDLGFGTPVISLTSTIPTRDGNGYLRSGYLNATISRLEGTHFGAGFIFQAQAGQLGAISTVVTCYADAAVSREFEFQVDGSTGIIRLFIRSFNYGTGATTVTIPISVASSVAAGLDGNNYGDGLRHTAWLALDQSGGNIAYNLSIDGASIGSGTIAGNLTTLWQLHVAYDPVTSGGPVSFGYLSAYQAASVPSAAAFANVATGYAGEYAADRILRLAAAAGITAGASTPSSISMPMGPQSAKGVLALMQEAAASDGGFLYDQRAAIGLGYNARAVLYNLPVTVVLDWSTNIFGGDPAPTDDDQTMRNDVTATNYTGTSSHQQLATGPLSVQAPPNGVNTYPTSVSVNVASDGYLPDIARWVLAQDTVDKPRWPALPINMLNGRVRASSALFNQIADATPSAASIVQIKNLPAPNPPDAVLTRLLGLAETVAQDQWQGTWNCPPADVYTVPVWGSMRFDAENSTVGTGFNTVAASLQIASAANTQLWTTDGTMMPFDIIIAGERMTVTNITGASSPQTFTVTRSVNGVVKSHLATEAVHIFDPMRWAL